MTHYLQHQQIIHDLQENLDQMIRDKVTLESKIIEMASYKNEMLALQGEITKLQVRPSPTQFQGQKK